MRVVILTAALLAVTGCGRSSAEHVITMQAMTFDPPTLTVKSGDRIVWKNADLVPHTATAKGRFDSGSVAPDGSFRVTLTSAGAIDYGCTLHPMMKGKLIVE